VFEGFDLVRVSFELLELLMLLLYVMCCTVCARTQCAKRLGT
jgi:hypothetical protein